MDKEVFLLVGLLLESDNFVGLCYPDTLISPSAEEKITASSLLSLKLSEQFPSFSLCP